MKMSKILMMVFTFSFLVGIGLISIAPATVQADVNPCSNDCYMISCYFDASCNPVTERMHQKCYPSALVANPCRSLYNCTCVDIGCGPLCFSL